MIYQKPINYKMSVLLSILLSATAAPSLAETTRVYGSTNTAQCIAATTDICANETIRVFGFAQAQDGIGANFSSQGFHSEALNRTFFGAMTHYTSPSFSISARVVSQGQPYHYSGLRTSDRVSSMENYIFPTGPRSAAEVTDAGTSIMAPGSTYSAYEAYRYLNATAFTGAEAGAVINRFAGFPASTGMPNLVQQYRNLCASQPAALASYNVPATVTLNCSAVEVENVVNDHFCTTVQHPNGLSVVNNFKQTFDEITINAGLDGFFLTQSGACSNIGPYTGEVFQFAAITENRGPGLVGREPAYGYYVFEQASLRSRFQFSRLSCNTRAILPQMSIPGTRSNPGNIVVSGVTYTKVGSTFEDGWRFNPGTALVPEGIPGVGDCTVRPLTSFTGDAAKLQYECVRTAPQIPATTRYIETVIIN